jgi:hypothetical protein
MIDFIRMITQALARQAIKDKMHKHLLQRLLSDDYDNARSEHVNRLCHIVFDNLDNAKANGEFEVGGNLDDKSPKYIADDLIMLVDECEDLKAGDLTPYIRDWLARNQK